LNKKKIKKKIAKSNQELQQPDENFSP
jgi:hypothetical protein